MLLTVWGGGRGGGWQRLVGKAQRAVHCGWSVPLKANQGSARRGDWEPQRVMPACEVWWALGMSVNLWVMGNHGDILDVGKRDSDLCLS